MDVLEYLQQIENKIDNVGTNVVELENFQKETSEALISSLQEVPGATLDPAPIIERLDTFIVCSGLILGALFGILLFKRW